ncbi:MAG TPA: crotonase/enoyl-CoA hydratase family protein [Acidimicrobiales bacterium]|nr:crotonase/enoyl-CoA hydratase family protein [Acidimicrobiales bacterium]
MPASEDVRYEVERGRARIILDRPEKRNAVTGAMSRTIHDLLWEADEDTRVHSMIIKGRGPSFCAGADLSRYRMEDDQPDAARRTLTSTLDDDIWQIERGQRANIAPFDVHKPVIAQVQGHCLALGTVIAMFCDFIICADDARFGFPPARDLGTPPSNMWLYHVGPQWAKRLTMTGDTISGREAADLGLALKSVPLADLEAEVEQLADRLSLVDHHLLAANKRIINLGLELMGARTLQRLSAEIDGRAHLAPGTAEYTRRVTTLGWREGIRARDAAFGDGKARVHGPERRDEHGRLVDD